jgi:hypothetical protein
MRVGTKALDEDHGSGLAVSQRGSLPAGISTTSGDANMKSAIVNLQTILTGDWRDPIAKGDSILMADGKITSVGTVSADAVAACDVVIDADKATAVPGFIDSQVHLTFGDYTPRQKTVGFLDSYVHGGTTTSISASEVHVPGRPKDPAGVKALAVAAFKCFEHFRPGGMRVYGGSVILEPAWSRPISRKSLPMVYGLPRPDSAQSRRLSIMCR